MNNITTTVTGYPRIGEHRELKTALESFFRGETGFKELSGAAAEIRKHNYALMQQEGLDLIPVGDFSFYDKITRAREENSDGMFDGLNLIYNNFVYDYLYEDPFYVMAFIENHDTDRFLGEGKDIAMLKQAYAILLTAPRIPQLYYGTEVLMNGVKKVSDGYVRCDFMGGWQGDAQNKFTSEGRTAEENDMFNYLRTILHWRKGNKVITEGKMVQFIPRNGVYAYCRSYGGKSVLVVLNGGNKPAEALMTRFAEVTDGFTRGKDVTTGESFPLDVNIPLLPRQSLILELQ